MILSLTLLANHPLIIVLIILITSISRRIEIFIVSNNQWISYILILAFLGGLIILFLYIASLTPNQKFNRKHLFIIIPILMLYSNEKIFEFSNIQINIIYRASWNVITIILILIIIILTFVIKLIYNPFNPLKRK